MPDSTSELTKILDDVTTTSLLSVHVMSAAGMLPLWMQNSCSGSPSFSVVALGLIRNESRMSELIREKSK